MTETSAAKASRRIILDVSSIARWLGPPVGIMRTEHALARHAFSRRPDIQFSFFDKAASSFRTIDPAWSERLIGWNYAIDLVTLDVRRGLKGLARLRPSRYPPTMALERWRLAAERPAIRRLIYMGQRLMWLPGGLPPPFTDRRGSRFGIVPIDLALGAPLILGPDDVIVSVGDDWFHKEAVAIAALKRRYGFRYVVMCHDLIPVMFPAFFPERDAALFQHHWTAMFPAADRILVTSEKVGADVRRFCGTAGIGHGEIVRVQLGYDPVRVDPGFVLPRGLESGKYALFVGTIEPRKGHAMLLDVWRRLVDEGLPRRQGFKLVLVGRPGWNVEDVLGQIADSAIFSGTLLHFPSVDDRMLAGLYRDAAFCLYPSIYEGFGLPVIEAFAHGKAVIASTGGAVPEAVGSLSPCLPVGDIPAWLATIRRWIEEPDARAPYEKRIRESFAYPTWDQAAVKIFEAVRLDR